MVDESLWVGPKDMHPVVMSGKLDEGREVDKNRSIQSLLISNMLSIAFPGLFCPMMEDRCILTKDNDPCIIRHLFGKLITTCFLIVLKTGWFLYERDLCSEGKRVKKRVQWSINLTI